MTCQVIWPKRTFLHFCTLQIQYHIWGVPNFFSLVVYRVYFKVFLKRLLENIPLKVAELPQVTLFKYCIV